MLDTAILIEDFELQARAATPAVYVAPSVEAQLTPVPAVAHDHTDCVVARLEQFRDVVGLVLKAAMVGGPSRREHLVAHAGAVEVCFVQTETRRVESRPRDDAVHAEHAAEERRWTAQAVAGARGGADPCRCPVG